MSKKYSLRKMQFLFTNEVTVYLNNHKWFRLKVANKVVNVTALSLTDKIADSG